MTNTPAVQEPKKPLKPVDEIRGTMNQMEGQFRNALPPQIDPAKFIRVAMTAIGNNKDLLDANRQTLFVACLKCAQDGLLPDGREAALVTFKGMVQYMPMIGGILKKVRNSGELSSIAVEVVHEKDGFGYWVDNDGAHLEHRPLLFAERGEAIGVYSIAKTKDGGVYIEVMSAAQVERVRSVSRAKNGPWNEWYEEMAKKTVMRRLSKRLPMSSDLDNAWKNEDEVTGYAKEQDIAAIAAAPAGDEPKPAPKRSSRMSRLVSESAPEPSPEPTPAPTAPPPLSDDEKLPFEMSDAAE